MPDTPAAPPAAQAPAASGPTGGGAGPAPLAPPAGAGAPAAPPPMPLGPAPTPPPAAPSAPIGAGGPLGPGVAPAAASTTAGTVGAPAPVPVSAARAEREAIAAASTAGALRRLGGGNDPLQLARRVGAALNAGENTDFGFFWITAVTTDGTIVVANSYGIAYIPEGVNLPDQVKMASADESIPVGERAKWATYPILAVQGWAQHHNTALRAVVATEEQFTNFDPGAAKITLQPDDIPANGQMEGRSRLAVIAPEAATRLAAVSDAGLTELLPAAPADVNPPADESLTKWFEVTKPMFSTASDRGVAHLQAFVAYADHAQELAVYRAHTADAVTQRAAIADWVYWQHLSVLISDSLSGSGSK